MTKLEDALRSSVEAATSHAAIEDWKRIMMRENSAPFNYRLDHVIHVVQLSCEIGKKEGADLEALAMAAWLHDISKPGLGPVKDHGRKSAEVAGRFLRKHGISRKRIDIVKDTIMKHVGLTLQEPLDTAEARSLWDADKLVKLGAVGIIHYILNSVLIEPGRSSSDFLSAFDEFLPLAESIAKSMNTELGKLLAADRLAVLKVFRDALRMELELKEERR